VVSPADAAAATTTSRPGAGVFAWSAWGLSLLLALAYVVAFGADVPRNDDYAVVPQLCGDEPVTAGWLWSQHSEHRIPIARLVLLGVFALDGADPRPVMLLIVLLLAAGGAAALVAVGRAPGGRSYADAFLPLAFLGLGHHENLLWAIQVTYVAPVALFGVAAGLAASRRERPGPARAAAFGACLAAMPLCNAGGLLLIPAPILWLLANAGAEARSGDLRRAARIAACATPAALLGALYLRGYSAPRHHAAPGGIAAAVRATFQFLATGFGPAGIDLWPWSGLAAGAFAAGAVMVVAVAWLKRPGERPRVGGLAAMLASALLLAFATGWGRSGEGEAAGLQPRYVTLATPALVAAYLAFAFLGGRILRTVGTVTLFAAAGAASWPNALAAVRSGREAAAQAAEFDRDRDAGEPIFRVVRRNVPFLYPSQQGLHDNLARLREAGVGKFRRLGPDPAFEERPLELRPTSVRMARWEDGVIDARGPDPWVRFDLPGPLRVAGVRIRYDHRNDDGAPARFKLGWKAADRYDAPEVQYGDWFLPTGDDRTTTVWIDGPVALIRLQPDNRPCRFRLREVTLLVEP